MKRITDKQRMDWLERGSQLAFGDGIYYSVGNEKTATKNGCILPARQAIDAAIKASRRKP